MDFSADPLGSIVAGTFGLVGGLAWMLALWRVARKDESLGLQERWGGFGHGLGGWSLTPPFTLMLIGASAIGITIAVMPNLPEYSSVRDADGDGVIDRNDQCPAALEDLDGHWDNDGCPDPDNDEDGRLDSVDQCPADPEDVDGFEDIDGCPDPDNDGDGILDGDDQCPGLAEDRDGFEDADGCPDPDNDGDGVCDPGIDPTSTGAACRPWQPPQTAAESDAPSKKEDRGGSKDGAEASAEPAR